MSSQQRIELAESTTPNKEELFLKKIEKIWGDIDSGNGAYAPIIKNLCEELKVSSAVIEDAILRYSTEHRLAADYSKYGVRYAHPRLIAADIAVLQRMGVAEGKIVKYLQEALELTLPHLWKEDLSTIQERDLQVDKNDIEKLLAKIPALQVVFAIYIEILTEKINRRASVLEIKAKFEELQNRLNQLLRRGNTRSEQNKLKEPKWLVDVRLRMAGIVDYYSLMAEPKTQSKKTIPLYSPYSKEYWREKYMPLLQQIEAAIRKPNWEMDFKTINL